MEAPKEMRIENEYGSVGKELVKLEVCWSELKCWLVGGKLQFCYSWHSKQTCISPSNCS